MGFLNQGKAAKGSGIYLEITDSAKMQRPLVKAPTPVWVHTIPEVKTAGPTGQPLTLRRFSTEACTSNSRSGSGCQCCMTQDPLWDLLDAKNKFNRKGARTDFPKKCIQILPTFDHSTASVKIMKGGNQLFETMDGWYESQPDETSKDLRRCDWQVWKTGKGMLTHYTVNRQDSTPFNFTPEMLTEGQTNLQQAIQDLQPVSPEIFYRMINGEDLNSAVQQNLGLAQFAVQAVNAPQIQQPVVNLQTTPPSVNLQTTPPSVNVQAVPQPIVNSTPPAHVNIPTQALPQPTNSSQPVSSAAAEFVSWINSQPEFGGVGVIRNLMPVLREQLNGSTDYHLCTPEQIVALKSALTMKLSALRTRS